MAMTKNTKTGLYAAGALGGLLLLMGALSKEKKHKSVVRPGETTERYMGESFLLRLPPGQYQMLGGEGLTIVSQSRMGNATNLSITVGTAPTEFIVQPKFVDLDDSSKQYDLTVIAHPWSEAG